MKIKLPATSANLGPGFDAVALALRLFLEIEAAPAPRFSIDASGRNRELCAALEHNLLLETYRSVLAEEKREATPLAIGMRNGIPVGMGCGSSAAVRLAGVALASHFGDLGWDAARILSCAARLEGHSDNVAACWHGGLALASDGPPLAVVSIPPPAGWRALLVLPENPVATAKARKVLPETYTRQDIIVNLQSVALLTAAFALDRPDLLAAATRDRLHQPFRADLCPLLPALLPMSGTGDVFSATLSGAGPSVLLLVAGKADEDALRKAVAERIHAVCPAEILFVDLCREGAVSLSPS